MDQTSESREGSSLLSTTVMGKNYVFIMQEIDWRKKIHI
jgi:hypothetical protein